MSRPNNEHNECRSTSHVKTRQRGADNEDRLHCQECATQTPELQAPWTLRPAFLADVVWTSLPAPANVHQPLSLSLSLFTQYINISLSSTHANRQGVDISFTVCLFVRLQISPPTIKLAASNFALWFIGILGRESPILGNFAPPDAQNWTNRLRLSRWAAMARATRACATAMRRIGMDIRPSPKTDVLVIIPSTTITSSVQSHLATGCIAVLLQFSVDRHQRPTLVACWLGPSLRISGQLPAPIVNGRGDSCWK